MVDGASALLHLVLASIERDRKRDIYRSNRVFHGSLGGSPAAQILGDHNILNTPLYIEDILTDDSGKEIVVYYRLRHKVEELLDYLKTLIDHQVLIANQDGYWLPPSIRKSITKGFEQKLVGYDLQELISARTVK